MYFSTSITSRKLWTKTWTIFLKSDANYQLIIILCKVFLFDFDDLKNSTVMSNKIFPLNFTLQQTKLFISILTWNGSEQFFTRSQVENTYFTRCNFSRPYSRIFWKLIQRLRIVTPLSGISRITEVNNGALGWSPFGQTRREGGAASLGL